MRLGTRQWGLVVSALEQCAVLDEENDELEAAANSPRVTGVVRAAFEQQGVGPIPAVRPE